MYWSQQHPHPIKYYWQCAYVDAKADPWVLPDYVYHKLCNYDKNDSSYLQKYYISYDQAMADYKNIISNPHNMLCDNCWINYADGIYSDVRDIDFTGYMCNKCYKSKFRSLLDIILENRKFLK